MFFTWIVYIYITIIIIKSTNILSFFINSFLLIRYAYKRGTMIFCRIFFFLIIRLHLHLFLNKILTLAYLCRVKWTIRFVDVNMSRSRNRDVSCGAAVKERMRAGNRRRAAGKRISGEMRQHRIHCAFTVSCTLAPPLTRLLWWNSLNSPSLVCKKNYTSFSCVLHNEWIYIELFTMHYCHTQIPNLWIL